MKLTGWWNNLLESLKSGKTTSASSAADPLDKGPKLRYDDGAEEDSTMGVSVDENKIEEINTDVTSEDVHGLNIDLSDFDSEK